MNKFIKETIRAFHSMKLFGFCNGLMFMVGIIIALFILGGWGIKGLIAAGLGLISAHYIHKFERIKFFSKKYFGFERMFYNFHKSKVFNDDTNFTIKFRPFFIKAMLKTSYLVKIDLKEINRKVNFKITELLSAERMQENKNSIHIRDINQRLSKLDKLSSDIDILENLSEILSTHCQDIENLLEIKIVDKTNGYSVYYDFIERFSITGLKKEKYRIFLDILTNNLENKDVQYSFTGEDAEKNYSFYQSIMQKAVTKFFYELYCKTSKKEQQSLLTYIENSLKFSFEYVINDDETYIITESDELDFYIKHIVKKQYSEYLYYINIDFSNKHMQSLFSRINIRDLISKAIDSMLNCEGYELRSSELYTDNTYISPAIKFENDYDAKLFAVCFNEILRKFMNNHQTEIINKVTVSSSNIDALETEYELRNKLKI